MKTKFEKLLREAVKDFGLTEKAVSELVNLGSGGLTDDSSEEDIKSKVDSIVPFAKTIQAEVTRKAQANKQPNNAPTNINPIAKEGEDANNKGGEENVLPAWFTAEMAKRDAQLKALQDENANLKKATAQKQRSEQISQKAQELGIPSFLMKRFSIAEDADIEKELTDYKQDLVNNKLMPEQGGHEKGTSDVQLKDDAKRWADGLPSKA